MYIVAALAWGMYFIATHPEVDEKVYEEIQTVLGDEAVDHTNIGNLVYVLNNSLPHGKFCMLFVVC